MSLYKLQSGHVIDVDLVSYVSPIMSHTSSEGILSHSVEIVVDGQTVHINFGTLTLAEAESNLDALLDLLGFDSEPTGN